MLRMLSILEIIKVTMGQISNYFLQQLEAAEVDPSILASHTLMLSHQIIRLEEPKG
jgi:hypothetical protein